MTARPTRPDVEAITANLKDFQRATVDHAFHQLWIDGGPTSKFLVADEVGLGKTMVAKGVIAKTVDHLWDTVPRIDIVYICSNAQIAEQNINHLRQVAGESYASARRLTLLPTEIKKLEKQKVNFIAFTPGTSFNLHGGGGRGEERVLLYWILARLWGRDAVRANRWYRFFEGGVGRDRFREMVHDFDPRSIDDDVVAAFGKRLRVAANPDGRLLETELRECVDDFNYLRGKPKLELSRLRYRIIGKLRTHLAHACVHALEPDLVILDEFQRFKDILATDSEEVTEAAELATAIFDHPRSRTLLLSATPYKMYTLPDEPEGDDHYADFTRTVRFLAGKESAREITQHLRTLRETLIMGGDPEVAMSAKRAAEAGLRKVMSRTERLAATPDRDGMLKAQALSSATVTANDVRTWRTFNAIARAVDGHDVFEYWRSTPYPLNMMERSGYKVIQHLMDAVETQNAEVRRELERGHGLLSWEAVRAYQQIDPGNLKIRGLMADVLDRGAWRLAWLPPTLPYYRLGGAYADPALAGFTKRLVFSAWNVVPKAISVMLSYEAERRTVTHDGSAPSDYDSRSRVQPLQYRITSEGAPGAMSLLTLMYPSVTLSELGDPLTVARELGTFDADLETVLGVVRDRIREELAHLDVTPVEEGRADLSWYWAAPLLFDRRRGVAHQDAFESALGDESSFRDRVEGRTVHLNAFRTTTVADLGPMPDDLADVLARMALAGPAVTALRALSRVCGGPPALADPDVRRAAFGIATGFRLMLNKQDLITLLRHDESGDSYWRSVLQHNVDGCLQAVLDEYFHGLVESRSMQNFGRTERANALAEVCREALGLTSVYNSVEHFEIDADGRLHTNTHRMRLNVAARFGRATGEDGAEQRESSVRVAFNSPFRPFVLASTSVGQEGLDFHTYCHAIVHWNLPGNPVDLEQREGRVHRYKGHAIRKNVARAHADAALHATVDDPWYAMFLSAVEKRAPDASELNPFWVYPVPEGGASIERYVPAAPLSREAHRYERLLRSVGAYRMVIGQPRQEELLRYLRNRDIDGAEFAIDLSPPWDVDGEEQSHSH